MCDKRKEFPMYSKKTLALAVSIGAFILQSCGGSITYDFDDVALGEIPEGFEMLSVRSNRGQNSTDAPTTPTSEYQAVEDESAPNAESGNRVMKVEPTNNPLYEHAHILWTDELDFTDGIVQVDLKATDNQKGHGGVVWRFQDHTNYYAVRYQNMNGDVRIIRVKDGQVSWESTPSHTAPTDFDQWRTLRVEVEGNNIRVYIDDVQFIDFTDDNPGSDAGGVGLFARGDVSIVSFDNLTVSGNL